SQSATILTPAVSRSRPMSWWPRPPTPPTAVVDPSPMTATFTASLGPPARGPAPSISRGIPSPRPAVIEPLRKLPRGLGFMSLAHHGPGVLRCERPLPGLRADGYDVVVARRPACQSLASGPGFVDPPPEVTRPARRQSSRGNVTNRHTPPGAAPAYHGEL